MAAYAALTSLMHIIEQIEHHPHPPISLDKLQVESLTEKVAFLQDFLEGYSHEAGYRREADYLEKRIADTAEAAEDIIESHIVDQIFTGMWGNNLSVDLYQGLQEVMFDMDSLRKEVMEIKEKMGVQDQLHKDSSISAGLLRSPMVSFDEVLDKVMDKLIGQRSNLENRPNCRHGRNLVIAHKWGSSGKIKLCKVHDLLRDLCLREADKQKFVCLLMQQHLSPRGRFNGRRIAIHQCMSPEKYHSRASHAPEYGPLARSLVWDFNAFQYGLLNWSVKWHSDGDMFKIILRSGKLRLLRIFKLDDRFPVDDLRHEYNKHFKDVIIRLLNSRYLSYPDIGPSLPSSISRLWNHQTLIARDTSATAPPEIWKMPLLKHVEFCNIYLPDPPIGETGDDFVLENLQTLFRIRIWDCRVKVVEKIPNIKICQGQGEAERLSLDFLNNLSNLHKLESLCCFFIQGGIRSALLQNLMFPHSLKKLALHGCCLHWEDMTTTIGSLPLLEVLKLERNSFIGPHWETVEGDFCSLKFLLIRRCPDLEYWDTESTHFPCLEHLRLDSLMNLEKIPQDIGDIPTLQSIELVNCGVSAVISAKWILEEQEELGNEALHVRVVASKDDQVLESLRSHNFQVETRRH
ncbi:hypothetical protein ACS0TY_035408 [Phlomoides rotata]